MWDFHAEYMYEELGRSVMFGGLHVVSQLKY